MTKKRDVIISSGKGTPITIGKKERRTDLLPEHHKDYEEKCVQVLNEKNNTNFKTFQECSNEGLIQVIQIQLITKVMEYRLVNYLIKHIIGLRTMTTRKQEHFKISRIIWSSSKTICERWD